MSAGPIPQITFNSGVAYQQDGQHPQYLPQPQPNQQSQQSVQNDQQAQVLKTLETLPPEAQQMLKSINPWTFKEAQAILNKLTDEVLMERNQTPIQQQQSYPVQNLTPVQYARQNMTLIG